jgi:hypothetical protein
MTTIIDLQRSRNRECMARSRKKKKVAKLVTEKMAIEREAGEGIDWPTMTTTTKTTAPWECTAAWVKGTALAAQDYRHNSRSDTSSPSNSGVKFSFMRFVRIQYIC